MGRIRRAIRVPGGYARVLLMIVMTYLLALQASRPWGTVALVGAQAVTLWQVLRTARAARGPRLWAHLTLVLAGVAVAVGLFTRGAGIVAATFLASTLMYVLAPFAVVGHIGRRDGVDRETMLGALSAYLLLGMAFGFAYRCLSAVQPGLFFAGRGGATMSQLLFFSFVTLTTTGYGDLVPAGNPGQTVAVVEALLGQLFLVTAVAKIVEAWRPRGWRERTRRTDDDTA